MDISSKCLTVGHPLYSSQGLPYGNDPTGQTLHLGKLHETGTPPEMSLSDLTLGEFCILPQDPRLMQDDLRMLTQTPDKLL